MHHPGFQPGFLLPSDSHILVNSYNKLHQILSFCLLTNYVNHGAPVLLCKLTASMKGAATMAILKHLADIICNTVLDPVVLQKARRRKGAFTRNDGKLPYLAVIKLLLQNSKRSISSVLKSFFKALAESEGIPVQNTVTCSHQAFSKARGGINHYIFKECFKRILDFLCNPETNENQERLGGLWGIQPIAIDGSRIPLPNRKALRDIYGGLGPDGSSPTALASIAFDVLRGIVLDADLDSLSVGERALAKRHLQRIGEFSRVNPMYALYIFDRGYASRDLILYLRDVVRSRFLFRLRSKFNVEIDALPLPKGDEIVNSVIMLDGDIMVRIIRFLLPDGETVETLMTNEFGLDEHSFKWLYFLRWPCETEYSIIKNKIGLINFKGYAENSVLQEFWISMLMANIAAIAQKEADGILKGGEPPVQTTKHRYKINLNEMIGCICDYFPDCLDVDSPEEQYGIIHFILRFSMNNKIVDKKGIGESNPRDIPRAVKWHYNVKLTH